ncbi:unnamed protein product [Orchesella dallaii]|uniref:Uncharacterized protein n=1 Tax=Orchesella dallaii TaxID=48710 RepID=A0ABP1RFJ3_9HEXA
MDDRKRNYILTTKHLYLIKNTRITATLLSQIGKHLSEYDKQKLNKIGKLETDIDQAVAFYELVVTKAGLYNLLIEALDSEQQFGPANCLRELLEDQPQPQLQASNNGGANGLSNPPQQNINQPHLNHQNQDEDEDEEEGLC